MNDQYATYNLREIKSIINQAIEAELWATRDHQEHWESLLDLKTQLFDLFNIEDN